VPELRPTKVAIGRASVALMKLGQGNPIVAIPGPTILPERVRQVLAEPMPDIYSGPLLDISDRVLARLPGIAQTSGKVFVMTANGHGAWQMALSNLVSPGETVLVLESGRFAVVWGEYAKRLGVTVETVPCDFRSPVDVEAVAARLQHDQGGLIKAILVVQTDTASSVRNDIPAIRRAIDSAEHDALLMVDGIASLGCEEYEMDAWGVDVTIGATQKGLMCPPGVSFVWANDRAIETYRLLLQAGGPRVGYFDWESRIEPRYIYETFAGTPPIAHIRALDVALDLIEEEGGLAATWERHRVLADAVRAAVQAWSTDDGIDFNIVSPGHRSNSVTTVLTGGIDAVELRRRCNEEGGLTLGIGISDDPHGSFRIGHMGHIDPPMILGALGTIEATMTAMAAPIGASGVAAAANSIGRALGD
jgi:alanine-glyoxylate transaminase/serine-glyoxylate transaminase/serine-pyruvate transaminase